MTMLTPEKLTQSLKSAASEIGFDLCGVCPAVPPTGFTHLEHWLDAGYAGEMSYLETRREAYRHPQSVLDGAKSLLVLAINYQTIAHHSVSSGQGKISRYAWSDADYHDVIHKRLKRLIRHCQQIDPKIKARGVVDTAPLLEREFAQLAGLGWRAKNTMLINRQLGSWFFLSAVLLDHELVYDEPFESFHCGTCTACLEACPTNAFVEPGVLDARRCISYLTIELRSPIAPSLREPMGEWVFGCDICQDVCPWNNKAEKTEDTTFQPRVDANPLNLRELFFLSDESFRQRFRKTPLWRSKRRGIVRNAAIVLGNRPSDANLPALKMGINDDEPLIRGASAWALGRHSSTTALSVLLDRRSQEADGDVKSEIGSAIANLQSSAPRQIDH